MIIAKKLSLFVVLFFCLLGISHASNTSSPWFSTNSKHQVNLRVDMFVASTCPHCQKAEVFFQEAQANYPWLTIYRYVINQDKAALEKFYHFLKQKDEYDFAVPSIVFCNTRWVGFSDTHHDGQALLNAMAYCQAQIVKTGQLSVATEQTLKKMAAANWYQTNLDTNQNAFVFIPIMAILDALTPTAIIVALTLLSFLLILKPYQRTWLIISSFLIAIAIPHYLQQMHLAFFDVWLIALDIPLLLAAILLFIGLLYLYLGHCRQLKDKPFLFVWFLMLIMAVIVPLYQQNYTPDFALIFRQWLDAKSLPAVWFGLHVIFYQLIYLIAIALLVRSFMATSRYCSKRFASSMVVTEFCWHFLLLLTMVLIISPLFLATFMAPMLMVLLAFVTSQVSHRLLSRR